MSYVFPVLKKILTFKKAFNKNAKAAPKRWWRRVITSLLLIFIKLIKIQHDNVVLYVSDLYFSECTDFLSFFTTLRLLLVYTNRQFKSIEINGIK